MTNRRTPVRAFGQAAAARRRARDFDREFRPAPRTRDRWLRVWIAGHRGAVAIDAIVVG
jgi:hypothetical protein